MFKRIGLFTSLPLYVLLYKNRVKIYRLDTGKSIEKKSIKPFSNSRLLLGNFQVAQSFLKKLISSLLKDDNYIISPNLLMLIHQIEIKEDGITEVEKRALLDLAKHTNAKETYLYFNNNELTLKEALLKIKTKNSVI